MGLRAAIRNDTGFDRDRIPLRISLEDTINVRNEHCFWRPGRHGSVICCPQARSSVMVRAYAGPPQLVFDRPNTPESDAEEGVGRGPPQQACEYPVSLARAAVCGSARGIWMLEQCRPAHAATDLRPLRMIMPPPHWSGTRAARRLWRAATGLFARRSEALEDGTIPQNRSGQAAPRRSRSTGTAACRHRRSNQSPPPPRRSEGSKSSRTP